MEIEEAWEQGHVPAVDGLRGLRQPVRLVRGMYAGYFSLRKDHIGVLPVKLAGELRNQPAIF